MKRMASKWNVLILCGFVCLIRVALLLIKPEIGDPLKMDALAYNRIADHIIHGDGFVQWETPTVFVAPLYPYFLAGLYQLFGVKYLLAKLVQILLAGFTAWILFQIARRLFSETVGYITLVLFAVHPALVAIPAFLYTETLNILLLCAAVFYLVQAVQKPFKRSDWAFAGFFLGLSTLVKGTTMMFPFLLLAAICCMPKLRGLWKRWSLFFLIFGLVMTPWTIRNYIQFKVFLPVATGSGEVLWTGNYLPFDGEYRYLETQNKISELAGGKPLIERDRILANEAKRMMLEHPGQTAILMLKKLYRFWFFVYRNVPTGDNRPFNFLMTAGLISFHLMILLAAVVGMIKTQWQRPASWIPILLFIYYTLIHTLTLAVPRHRIPLIPFILVFSAFGFHFLLSKAVNLSPDLSDAKGNDVEFDVQEKSHPPHFSD